MSRARARSARWVIVPRTLPERRVVRERALEVQVDLALMLLQGTRGGGVSARRVRRERRWSAYETEVARASRARRTKFASTAAARARREPRRWCRGARGRGGDVCQRRARLRTSTVRVIRVDIRGGGAFRSGGARPELSRGGFSIARGGHPGGGGSKDALDADELADIFRARLEVHPEICGFRLERRPRGLAPSPGVHEFHGRGVFELETELVAMEGFGDDRPDRGDIPVVRARARLTAPSPRDSRPRLVPGIAPVWAACVAKCRALISSPSRKKKPKPRKPKSQTSF